MRELQRALTASRIYGLLPLAGVGCVAVVGWIVAGAVAEVSTPVLAQSHVAPEAISTRPSLLGKSVVVQFRRDAMGIAGGQLINWNETRGGAIGVQGDVITFDDRWIVLRGTDSAGVKAEVWVPQHAVLNITTR